MTVRWSSRQEKISAFDEIRYILSISARAQANYSALTKHIKGLKDLANAMCFGYSRTEIDIRYTILPKFGIFSPD